MPLNRLFVIFFLAFAWLGGPAPARAEPPSARAVVATLHDELLAVMKASDTLGYAGRRDRLDPVIAKVFDLPTIARGSIGRYWKKLNPEQRKRLVAAMRRLTVATYAARFNGYAGETFRTLSETPGPRGTVLVATEIVKSSGDPVRLNYLLRPTKTRGWRIVDVYLKGIYSELALKRAEYGSVIRRKGFDGLIAALDRKADAFAAEAQAKAGTKAKS